MLELNTYRGQIQTRMTRAIPHRIQVSCNLNQVPTPYVLRKRPNALITDYPVGMAIVATGVVLLPTARMSVDRF